MQKPSHSPGPGRARRGTAQATRARLMKAGGRAFARKGLAGAKLKQDILEPAGVSVGSFYYQFEDKTALMLAIFEQHADDLRAQIDEAHRLAKGRSLVDIARDSYAILFDMADKYSDSMRIMLSERGLDEPRLQRAIEEDRKRWSQTLGQSYLRLADASRMNLDVELAVELTGAMTRGILDYYLELPSSVRPAARARLIDGLVRLTRGGFPALTHSDVDVPPSFPSRASGGSQRARGGPEASGSDPSADGDSEAEGAD